MRTLAEIDARVTRLERESEKTGRELHALKLQVAELQLAVGLRPGFEVRPAGLPERRA